MLNNASKLRRGNGGNRTHAFQVAFALPTKPKGRYMSISISITAYNQTNRYRRRARVWAVQALLQLTHAACAWLEAIRPDQVRHPIRLTSKPYILHQPAQDLIFAHHRIPNRIPLASLTLFSQYACPLPPPPSFTPCSLLLVLYPRTWMQSF
jgi:hypothetical protein